MKAWWALALFACGDDGVKHLPDAPPMQVDAAVDLDRDGVSVAQGDCNDHDAAIHPGASELCDAMMVDEDCDGFANDDDPEGSADGTQAISDADGDGYGIDKKWCTPPATTGTVGGDCDDGDATAYPGATELCDGARNDCANASWTLAEEDGLVTFVPLTPAAAATGRMNVTFSGAYTPPGSGTFVICPGTYTVNVNASGGAVEFRSRNGDVTAATMTILDGAGLAPVLQLTLGQFNVDGLTIRHGTGIELLGAGTSRFGGGIYAGGAIVDIRDSLIADNVADFGGGVYLHTDAGGSQLHVGNSTFHRNTGGIYVASPSTAEGTANFGDGNDENVSANVPTDIFAGTVYDYDGMKTFTCTASSCN